VVKKAGEGRCSAHHDEYVAIMLKRVPPKLKMYTRTKLEISDRIYRNFVVHNPHWMKLK
jgi:hypothetical protein